MEYAALGGSHGTNARQLQHPTEEEEEMQPVIISCSLYINAFVCELYMYAERRRLSGNAIYIYIKRGGGTCGAFSCWAVAKTVAPSDACRRLRCLTRDL
jgi:hypothetical protein